MASNEVLIDLLRGKFSYKPGLHFEQMEGDKFTTNRVTMTYKNRNESWPIVSYECEALVSVAKATGYSFLIGYNTEEHMVIVHYYCYEI